MDPVSAAASVVALLGASSTCAKFLRKIVHNANHAPDEILAMSNDVSDMNLVVSDLEANVRDLEEASISLGQPIGSTNIRDHLRRARGTVDSLEKLASDLFITLPNGKYKFQKLRWMRRQSEVVALKRELIVIKNSLNTILSSRLASNVARIQLSLRDVHLRSLAEVMSSMNEQNLIRSTSTATPSFPSISQADQRSEALFSSPDGSEEMLEKPMAAVAQISQFGTITLHLNRAVRCYGSCDCACHSRGRFQTPQFLEGVFGRLFLGYAGLPIFQRDCDRKTCTNQYSRAAQVTYTFPSWLLAMTVDLTAAMTYTNETHFGLKFINRVPDGENSVFALARSGNVLGIRELYVQLLTSPNDLCWRNGRNAVSYAIESMNSLETVGFLLDIVKIDPYQKEDRGWWVRCTRSFYGHPREGEKAIANWDPDAIFSKIRGDHAEIWDFSYIHSIVVGIHHGDLHSALLDARYRHLADVPDTFNRTPLFWAALRGDTRKAEILLAAGADPLRYDRDGSIPLHAAIRSGSVPCVELFLTRGALVHYRDSSGSAAIQIAAAFDANEAMLETLYLAGASVNVEMLYGESVLASAACCNRPKTAEWSIQKGAEIDHPVVVGYTPLMEAIRYCNAAVAEVLLRHAARVDMKTKGDRTLLHILASTGDLQGTELMARFPLPGLNSAARDSKDETAWQIFQRRVGPPAGMQEAFLRLLSHIDSQGTSDDNNQEEIFEDAVEVIA